MRLVRPALRIALVAGVVALTSFVVGGPSHSSATIVFDDCATGGATPTPKPSPTPTHSGPPPTPTPKPTPTPTPNPSAPPPQPSPSPAPQNCMPRSGERVWGTRTIRFHLQLGSFERVHHVALYVLADEKSGAHDVQAPLLDQTYTCDKRGATSYTVPWNTTTLTPYNGKYQVLVEATSYDNSVSCSDTTPADATRSGLLVDNPPPPLAAAPKTIASTASTITIQWAAPQIPDIVRYLVMRGVTTSTAKRPKYTDLKPYEYATSAAFRDQQVSPGVYWYSIIVMRRSVVSSDGVISSPMSPMSAGVEVKAPPPPPPGSKGPVVTRVIPLNRLALPDQTRGSDVIPDAPYSAQLPYGDIPEQGSSNSSEAAPSQAEPGGPAQHGPVLPLAVGAFLVSAALALSRMPY